MEEVENNADSEGYRMEEQDEDDMWDDDEDEEDVVQESPPVKCFFCEEIFSSPSTVLTHCRESHSFNLVQISMHTGKYANKEIHLSF